MSKIGALAWFFDQNRRVYPPRKVGDAYGSGGPIWREHWYTETVIGETTRSWVTNRGKKIPKAEKNGRWFAWDTDWIDKLAYVNDHAYKISKKVRQLQYDDLIKVAQIVGYAPKEDNGNG